MGADVGAVQHRFAEVDELRLHYAEQGEGPLVLLLHGFPECWYSWRHQFAPLAAAGYRVVAPDQRGYARSDRPAAIEDYTLLHLVGDVIGLVRELGEERCVVVGHDWGAPVAWTAAQLRPDVVRGVAGLSVPPVPRGPAPTLQLLRSALGDGFYQVYFQQPGVADAELAADPAMTFRAMLSLGSGDFPGNATPRPWVIPEGQKLTDTLEAAMAGLGELPGWLTEDDIDTFVREYADTGFTGGLNWYRNLDRNWALTAPFDGLAIQVPALYAAGDRDLVVAFPGMDQLIPALPELLPRLYRNVTLPGCGHWTPQERPDEVNALLLDFLRHLQEA